MMVPDITNKIPKSVVIGAGLIAAFLVINGAISYRNTRQLNTDAALVAHTHKVQELISNVMQSVLEAESGQRGFLITGVDKFLAPYEGALARLHTEMTRLAEATKDNPEQQARIQQLSDKVAQRLALLKEGIDLRHKSEEEAEAFIGRMAGQSTMQEIRVLVADMKQDEQDLLDERQQRSDDVYRVAVLTGVLTTLAGITLLGGFIWLLESYRRTREKAAAVVHEQREWLRMTLTGIGDAVVATDEKGVITFMNPVAMALTGWTEQDAYGEHLESVFKIVNEASRGTVENPALKALREGRVVGLANHTILIAKSGKESWIDDSAAPIRDEDQRIVGAVLVFRDVTERKKSEDDLKRQATLSLLRAEISQALAQTDDLPVNLQRCVEAIEANLKAALVRIWTFNHATEVLELQASSGINSSARGRHDRIKLGQFKVGRIAQERQPHLTNAILDDPDIDDKETVVRDGLVSFAGFPLLVEGRLAGVMAIFCQHPLHEAALEDLRTISNNLAQAIDRKRNESTAQLSEERFKTFAENGPMMVWAADATGNIHYLSPQWCEYTGLDSEATARPERVAEVVHPDDYPIMMELWEVAFATGQPYRTEFRLRRASDGVYRWFLCRAVPIRDRSGRIAQWVGANSDVDDQKRAEESLREADRRKDEFLAMLAHELRNPLAPIRNALQIMSLGGNTAESFGQVRDMMDRQVGQMTRLVDDLLDVSRITRGKVELREELLQIGPVIQNAVETSRPLIEEYRHDLVLDVPTEPIYVMADSTRLAQVLANLLNNSAKYTPPGGKLRVSVETADGQVSICVRDNGIGISPAMLPVVFEMFTQGNHNFEKSEGGLGIGLTLVRRLVEMHHGVVEARSEGPGRGSEFIVRLPVVRVSAAQGARRQADGRAIAAEPAATGLRILVVDDNIDSGESLGVLLRMMGNDAHVVHDGPGALTEVATFRPNVVLLDIGMPGMSGYEVARTIRQMPGGDAIVLIAQTGWGQEDDRRLSREAGFFAHLVKPVDHAELSRLLKLVPVESE